MATCTSTIHSGALWYAALGKIPHTHRHTRTDIHKGLYRRYIKWQRTKGNEEAWLESKASHREYTHVCTHNELLLYSSESWQNKKVLIGVYRLRMSSAKLISTTLTGHNGKMKVGRRRKKWKFERSSDPTARHLHFSWLHSEAVLDFSIHIKTSCGLVVIQFSQLLMERSKIHSPLAHVCQVLLTNHKTVVRHRAPRGQREAETLFLSSIYLSVRSNSHRMSPLTINWAQ